MSPVTVGIYVRSSAADQTTGQLQGLRAFATARGWRTFEFIDQGLSGLTGQHPALAAMLAAARGGQIGIVLCRSLDRLTRSPDTLTSLIEELTRLGVAVIVQR